MQRKPPAKLVAPKRLLPLGRKSLLLEEEKVGGIAARMRCRISEKSVNKSFVTPHQSRLARQLPLKGKPLGKLASARLFGGLSVLPVIATYSRRANYRLSQ